MSKITFRADDDLVERLEGFDASKSEVMREALRDFLDGSADAADVEAGSRAGAIDDLIADRVDDIVADRLETAFTPRQPRDVNVNIALDGDSAADGQSDASQSSAHEPSQADRGRKTDGRGADGAVETTGQACSQCGESIASGHVYCPNCGEKATRRVFCECGDELRSDWAFCPSCGRRTPAADVLDNQ